MNMSTIHPLHGIPRMTRGRPRGAFLRWRRQQLMASGIDELSAHRLAANQAVDVHVMLLAREQQSDLMWSDPDAPQQQEAE